MTDAPKYIWAFPKADWFDAGASTHKIKSAGAKDVEYIRSDLHADLLARADDLAEKVDASLLALVDYLHEPGGAGKAERSIFAEQDARLALAAYQKSREKLK